MGTKRLVQLIPYNITVSSTVLSAGGEGYYNGLNREAPPKKVTFFRLQVHEREGSFFIVEVYERDICHFSQLKDQNEISHRCILWMRETRIPVLAIYSYCKDGVFPAVKRDAAFKIRYVKGVPFVTTGYTKGVPFLSKMVHTKGKGLVPGAEPLRIKLQ